MSFKPKNMNSNGGAKRDFDPNRKFPEPKAGSRPARVSLVVDMGIQERPDFEDPKTKETRPQSPCQQVALFCDLVNDVVDYGGDIGMQPYRLLMNKSFAGDIVGINFTAVPPRDADGNQIQGKPWTFHPASLLTKVSKAIGKPEIAESQDLEEMLDVPFMATVEVKKTESNKVDNDGKPIIYTNINYKGCSEVPMVEDDEGNEKPMRVKPLSTPAMIISFDEAKPEQIKFLRKNLINKIKMAKNYAGSAMEAAIQAFEKQQNAQEGTSEDHSEAKKDEPKQPAKEAPKKAAKKAVEPPSEVENDDVDDTDCPF